MILNSHSHTRLGNRIQESAGHYHYTLLTYLTCAQTLLIYFLSTECLALEEDTPWGTLHILHYIMIQHAQYIVTFSANRFVLLIFPFLSYCAADCAILENNT